MTINITSLCMYIWKNLTWTDEGYFRYNIKSLRNTHTYKYSLNSQWVSYLAIIDSLLNFLELCVDQLKNQYKGAQKCKSAADHS